MWWQSRKAQHSSNTVVITQLNLLRELEEFRIQLLSHGQTNPQLSALTIQSSLVEEIQLNQESDPELQRIKKNLDKGKSLGFVVH